MPSPSAQAPTLQTVYVSLPDANRLVFSDLKNTLIARLSDNSGHVFGATPCKLGSEEVRAALRTTLHDQNNERGVVPSQTASEWREMFTSQPKEYQAVALPIQVTPGAIPSLCKSQVSRTP